RRPRDEPLRERKKRKAVDWVKERSPGAWELPWRCASCATSPWRGRGSCSSAAPPPPGRAPPTASRRAAGPRPPTGHRRADCHAVPPDEDLAECAADRQAACELVALLCGLVPDTAVTRSTTRTTEDTPSLVVKPPEESKVTQEQPPGRQPHTASQTPEPAT